MRDLIQLLNCTGRWNTILIFFHGYAGVAECNGKVRGKKSGGQRARIPAQVKRRQRLSFIQVQGYTFLQCIFFSSCLAASCNCTFSGFSPLSLQTAFVVIHNFRDDLNERMTGSKLVIFLYVKIELRNVVSNR